MNALPRCLTDLPLWASTRPALAPAVPEFGALSDADVLAHALWPLPQAHDLAVQLVAQHGSIGAVLAHAPARLARDVGNAAALQVAAVREAALRMLRDEALARPEFATSSELQDYLRARLGREGREHFMALFLDSKGRLLAEEMMGVGTIDHVQVYPRELARTALEHDAVRVVIAHNHPGGDPTPSRNDVAMTKKIIAGLNAIGVVLDDHIVVGRERCRSFRDMGLL